MPAASVSNGRERWVCSHSWKGKTFVAERLRIAELLEHVRWRLECFRGVMPALQAFVAKSCTEAPAELPQGMSSKLRFCIATVARMQEKEKKRKVKHEPVMNLSSFVLRRCRRV